MSKYEKVIQSPVGELTLEGDETFVTALRFGDTSSGGESSDTLDWAAEELAEYFSGKRYEFTVSVKAEGTDFQRSVWNELLTIPYGETASYADLACKIGNPNACRAVGGANNKNPLPILIPCHRVIGKNGELTGYAGGLAIKEFLLDLERRSK